MFYRNKFGRYNRYDYNWRGIQRKRFRGFTCKILLKNVKATISNDEIKEKIQLTTKKEAEGIVFRTYSRLYREDIKLAIVQMKNSHDATFVKNRMNGTRMENYTMYASYYWDRNNRNEKQKQQNNRRLNKANQNKNKEKNKKEEIVKKQKEKKKKQKTKEIKTKEKNKQRIQNTVFVGNLNRNTKEKEIMELMQDFDREEVEIVKGNNGKSKRFGFVSFKNKKDASYALNYNNYCFMGNKIRTTQSNDEKKQKKEIIKQPEEEEKEKEIKSNKQKEIEIEIEKNNRNQDSIVESDCQKEKTHENNILKQNELEETIKKLNSNQGKKEINKENIIPKDNCEKVQTQNSDQIQEEKRYKKHKTKKRTEK
ncbi:RNA recognition motif rrm domain containing protein [Anaeramoeba flamelloides]|uniref:RNA recognition motif rrm domain containing protein n=1 Tax=Anaeramoeba flamelloides TaxID=1746091 RepID=A0AAV7Z1A9_9EUKA|nr:RNA recognition motif rrm domain containing protein [Anaeramoeba flamelloides]